MSLSDKERALFEHIDELRTDDKLTWFLKEDVKQAVKELKDKCYAMLPDDFSNFKDLSWIDEIFGDKLI